MNTLKELVYDIWQAVHVEVTDETFLDERDIKFFIHNRRNMWLKNQLTRGRTFGSSIKQSLDVELEGANISGKYIKKSTVEVPEMMLIGSKPLLNRILLDNLFYIPINIAAEQDLPYLGFGKFNTNEPFAFIKDNYLYIISNAEIDYTDIVLEGVFRNPEEVFGFSDEDIYPLPDGIWQYIKGDILQFDIAPMLRINTRGLKNEGNEERGEKDGEEQREG